MPLAKTYEPEKIEEKHYAAWERSGGFALDPSNLAKSFTIVIPPPNITGSLHMGHALNNTLQDILVRFERMRGRAVLWQPGTDHAGIATQMVVERQLDGEGVSRSKLGREKFVKRIWQWKEQSGGAILAQLKRLGASADWSRERFTMDEGLSRAVRRVFVDLYRQGLIYKDNRLVNWDPKLHTAISDLEVESREVDGSLWHIRYPIEGRNSSFIIVATTRPETLLGDSAVAVHPADDRYKHLVGKKVNLPLVGKSLPIIADTYVDPEQGSGAVKITPGHDFNDFDVGRRHDLEVISIFDENGVVNNCAPGEYQGLERFDARKKILSDLEKKKLIVRVEKIKHTVPFGDRSGEPIEPRLTEQWYVDAKTLAKPAIEAVEKGVVVFVPRQWEKTYFEWMRNIEPWCISRQLWWGHQIPAWYGPDGHVFVEHSEREALKAAHLHYGKETVLVRDEDVLDTWFSSALWPFSTLGWPDETPEVKRHYPTDTLVTGFDIIFFWVARMLMMGIHFMKQPPFKTVYVHALVRDEKGHKMSKSKGNIIDPLEVIDDYGADALRFTLAAMAAQGRDIKLSESRVEGYRNFATKLWNAVRFCEINFCSLDLQFKPQECSNVVNRWIVGELISTIHRTTESIESYRFNDGADSIYQFTWHTFCDWYLEFIKPFLQGVENPLQTESRACAAWVLSNLLHALHPFVPFITEELWEKLCENSNLSQRKHLIVSEWPTVPQHWIDKRAKEEVDWIIRVINGVRSVRSEIHVPAGKEMRSFVTDANLLTVERVHRNRDTIRRLARLSSMEIFSEEAEEGVQIVIDEATITLPLMNIIDVPAECVRLEKEIEKITNEIKKIDRKFSNKEFVSKAPVAVVEKQKTRRVNCEEMGVKLRISLRRLQELS